MGVKTKHVEIPIGKEKKIRGHIYYFFDSRQPLIILIDSSTRSPGKNLEFAHSLALGGYTCFTPYSNPIPGKEEDITLLNSTIEVFNNADGLDETYKKHIKANSVGLIGCSSGGGVCQKLSEINQSNNLIKGLFCISPTATPLTDVKHPFFIFFGNADYQIKMLSWDRSHTQKSGILVRGGRHINSFHEIVFDTKFLTSTKSIAQIEDSILFNVLYQSLNIFLQNIFDPQSTNLLSELMKVYANFQDSTRILYHNPDYKQVIEGTKIELSNQKFSKIKLEDWKGTIEKLSHSRQTSDSSKNRADTKDSNNSNFNEKFLYSGHISTGFNFRKFRNNVELFIRLLDKKASPSCFESAICKITQVLLKTINSTDSEEEQLPIAKPEFPFVKELKSLIGKYIGSQIINKDSIQTELSKVDYHAAKFLQSIILLVYEHEIDTWEHAAFGREIKWTDRNSVYSITNFSICGIPKDTYLSIRMGQSYKGRNNPNQNEFNIPQLIEIYLYDTQKETKEGIEKKPYIIKLEPPKNREIEVEEPRNFIQPSKFYFENWIHDIGLQCYLTYYLIPIPPDLECLDKIKLHFLNKTGAIMLSEIALTN